VGRFVRVEVAVGDVMSTHADVLALKYAQAFYGVDKMVANRLGHPGRPNITPQVGGFRLVPSDGVVTAKRILFVGVRELYNFGYREIREFSIKVLSSLAGEASTTRVLALTLHGPGFGLDERECFLSEVAGVADAIASGDYPAQLEIVKIVEHNAGRARRLNGLLEKYFPGGNIDADPRCSIVASARNGLRLCVRSAMIQDKNLTSLWRCHLQPRCPTCIITVLSGR